MNFVVLVGLRGKSRKGQFMAAFSGPFFLGLGGMGLWGVCILQSYFSKSINNDLGRIRMLVKEL